MDPTANLTAQIKLAERIIKEFDAGDFVSPAEAAELAELVTALNEWITRGGSLPEQWKR